MSHARPAHLVKLLDALLGKRLATNDCLSANTSFADFPRVAHRLAADGYLTRPFAHRGRRLVFSRGIVVLAALACVLLVVFDGIADRLISSACSTTVEFAIGFAPEVVAVQVLTDDHLADDLAQRWHELVESPAELAKRAAPRLVVLRSEYRELFSPLAVAHHTSEELKAMSLYRGIPRIVVVSTPWYLSEWLREHPRTQGGVAK